MTILVGWTTWLLLLSVCFRLVNCRIDIIKDDNMRFWFKYSYAIVDGGEQWTDPSKHSSTCSDTYSSGAKSDFWLITQHITFDANASDNLHVEMATSGMFGELQVYLFLNDQKPNIPLYLSRADIPRIHNYLKSNFHFIFNNSYTKPITRLHNVVKTFSFNRNGSLGLTLGIRAVKAMGKLCQLKMFYNYCEERFINSAHFSKTFALNAGERKVIGSCSRNSVLAGKTGNGIQAFCASNGTWFTKETSAECLCGKGYEPSTDHGCMACPPNSFKQNVSNSGCTICPLNTVSHEDKTFCRCKDGYFKLVAEMNSTWSPCYARLRMDIPPNVIKLNNNSAKISWTIPNKTNSLNNAITFDVKCFTCQQENSCNTRCVDVTFEPSSQDIEATSVRVTNLMVGMRYEFRVYPKNKLNSQMAEKEWNFGNVLYVHNIVAHPTTPIPTNGKRENTNSGESGFPLYIVLVAVACLLLVLVTFLVALILRRKRMEKKFAGSLLRNAVELPSAGQRTYVDPTNYDTPEAALGEFAKELEPCMIEPEMLIGGGEFGDVYKGILKKTEDERVGVAIKTLKPDAAPKSEKDFLVEASIVGQFDHPNVVRLEGVITKNVPRMIVLEFMANGSLDNFLKVNDGRLNQVQLITMSKGVAAGMEYLADMNYVHRDLAARNILVSQTMVCKVSDFGLSRYLETTDSSRGEYSTSGGRIPMRWTAPEAIKYRKFSSASDVWSFGILLWEIMSFAERPYWEWDNFVVVEKVDNGYRLPAPLNCPKGVHDLMLHCWKQDRAERPNFTSITTVIDTWLETADTMNEDLASMTLLGQWLKRLKMGVYISNFTTAGYDKPSQVMDMTDERLKEIGVQLVGHRNKILKGIRVLKEMQKRRELNREISLEV